MYDGLSSVIVNASKTNKLFRKSVNFSSQTTSITIPTTDWQMWGDSSITTNNWSMVSNILFMQGDETTNRITGAIKKSVVAAVERTSSISLTCLYDNNL